MSEETPAQTPDYFRSAPGYTPPQQSVSNQDQAAFNAAIEAAITARLAQMGVQPVARARELSPEEAARAAIDNKGVGLGVDERLAELYRHLDTLAKKVGI